MSTQSSWWREFYTGMWIDVQQKLWSEDISRNQADFIEGVLHLLPGARILDVPCGEGRLACQLASRGYRVAGVDITAPLLEAARQKAEQKQLEITWENRDMRDLPWEAEFDAVVCFWGSFGYFDDAGNVDFLKAVYRALKPGGKFLLDAHVAESLFPQFQDRGWQSAGDKLVLESRRYDHELGRINSEWTLVSAGKSEKHISSIRVYTYRELCRMMQEIGFAAFESFGTLSQEPFKLGARRLYLVARK
jgi:SAM-dependent methyltransferase